MKTNQEQMTAIKDMAAALLKGLISLEDNEIDQLDKNDIEAIYLQTNQLWEDANVMFDLPVFTEDE